METVLLISGLWRRKQSMEAIGEGLSKQGYKIEFFDYPTMANSLEKNIDDLKKFILSLEKSKLHIVAHSMGGALALNMLMTNQDLFDGSVVCLGSPLKGSISAETLRMIPLGEAMLGKTMTALLDNEPMMAWQGTQKGGGICGDFPFGLGRIVCRLARPHDGTITMDESLIDGITDSVLISVNHVGMLYSKRVLKQIINFLKYNHFIHKKK